MKAPEARIFAKLKLIAKWSEAAEEIWARPVFDREKLEAMTNALTSEFGGVLPLRLRFGPSPRGFARRAARAHE